MVTEQLKAGFLEKLKIHKFKILGGILGFFIFSGVVFGAYKFGRKQTQSTLQPTPTLTATPIPTPTPEITPILTPTPTPIVIATPTPDPTANWKTYTNIMYGYSIKYPLEAEVKEVGYPDKDMCFNIAYKLTSITIVSPDAGGAGCIRTGVGYAGKEKEESIIVGNRGYVARGVEEMGPGETLNFHNETLLVKGGLDGPKGKLGLEYGSIPDENSTYRDYLNNKKYILLMLSTFKFLE